MRPDDGDPENAERPWTNVQEARKLLARRARNNLKAIRQLELDGHGRVLRQARPAARAGRPR